MVTEEEINKRKMRKRNMKLFPFYKKLAWDYIFFYTINFLFLTQVKGINPADVVLIDSLYYLFSFIAQMPATFIIEFLGRRNSIIFANIINCLYMVLIMLSKNLFNLVFAELLSSLAFAIKGSSEPALLNESIPRTKRKSEIFAKINEKGISSYYIINGISTVIAGLLYEVNPYIPILLSFLTLIIVTLISNFFIEPVKKSKKIKMNSSQIKDIRNSFRFILKSERIKSLILMAALMTGILNILTTYEISLVEDLNMPATHMGILFAFLGAIATLGTREQNNFHKKFKNKSLTILGLTIVGTCILSGISGLIAKEYKIAILLIIISYLIKHTCEGTYYALIGIFASFLLERMETACCMIAVGVIFAILMMLVSNYMKTRVGLKPDEYSKEEVKYDKLKDIIINN